MGNIPAIKTGIASGYSKPARHISSSYTAPAVDSSQTLTLFPNATSTVKVVFLEVGSTPTSKSYQTTLNKKFKITENQASELVKGSIHASFNNVEIVDREGELFTGIGGDNTENPTKVGVVDYTTKTLELSEPSALFFSNSALLNMTVSHVSAMSNNQTVSSIIFRTPGAPIRSGSLTVKGELSNGTIITGTSNFNGQVSGTGVLGYINSETGIGRLDFGEFVENTPANRLMEWYHPDNLSEDDTQIWKPFSLDFKTVTINCVIVNYLPLDSDLLKLDPVRLPLDGKVQIFRDGQVIVVHNTKSFTAPNNLIADQTFDIGRTDLSYVDLYDQLGAWVPDTKFSANLTTGIVAMANPLSLVGFTQPLVAVSKVEDMCLVSNVQITGHLSLTSKLRHNYDADDTYVSSVLPMDDLQSRAFNMFKQTSWTGEWSDSLIGNEPLAGYDFVNYPIQVNNLSAIQERFALIFTSPTTFNIVGENLGVIGTGNTSSNVSPVNPNTGLPIFTMLHGGFGTGYSSGNVIRFNVAGANYPIWFIRTTLQGPTTEKNDSYITQIRGNAS